MFLTDYIIKSSENVDISCALIVLDDHVSTIKRFEADIIMMTQLLQAPLLYISNLDALQIIISPRLQVGNKRIIQFLFSSCTL
jgi:hypothetical protein